MRYVIGALLAASMLAPIAAQAQRGEWRGNDRARVDVGVAAQARAPGPRDDSRADRERGPRSPDGARADRGFAAGPILGQVDAPGRVRDDRRFDGPRADPQRSDRRDDWTRSRFDGRSQFDGRGRVDDRRGYGYDTGYGRGYDDRRSGWDRGWRGQSRYDWTRYRTSNRNAFNLPRYYAPSGWNYGYRRFGVGVSLSSALWGRNYWIADPYAYRLPEVYGPYRWVRYYDDALLMDLESGQVVDAVYGIFW